MTNETHQDISVDKQTKQMVDAPEGAIFVCLSPHEAYRLRNKAVGLRRTDLSIHPITEFADNYVQKFHGMDLPEIVVDQMVIDESANYRDELRNVRVLRGFQAGRDAAVRVALNSRYGKYDEVEVSVGLFSNDLITIEEAAAEVKRLRANATRLNWLIKQATKLAEGI